MIKLDNVPEDLFSNQSVAVISLPMENVDLTNETGTVVSNLQVNMNY